MVVDDMVGRVVVGLSAAVARRVQKGLIGRCRTWRKREQLMNIALLLHLLVLVQVTGIQKVTVVNRHAGVWIIIQVVAAGLLLTRLLA